MYYIICICMYIYIFNYVLLLCNEFSQFCPGKTLIQLVTCKNSNPHFANNAFDAVLFVTTHPKTSISLSATLLLIASINNFPIPRRLYF